MASGRRVRRVFWGGFYFFWQNRLFWPALSDQQTTWRIVGPPDSLQPLTLMGWRRVVGSVMFSGYFFKVPPWFSRVVWPDTHHYQPAAIDHPVDVHDVSSHIWCHRTHGLGVDFCTPPCDGPTTAHHTSLFRHNHQKSFMTQAINPLKLFTK